MKTVAAFVLGWLCASCIFLAATVAEQLLEGREPAEIELHPIVPIVVAVYVALAAGPAYASVDWFARRDGPARTSWLAYCKAALAASVPYFVVFVLLFLVLFGFPSHPVYWLAGLLSALAYGSIGYWLVERGWPWQWRGRAGTRA